MDEATSKRLYDYVYQALDEDNAGTLEAFGANFLQNGAMWDLIADHFPTAKASEVRAIMAKAFGAWERDQGKTPS